MEHLSKNHNTIAVAYSQQDAESFLASEWLEKSQLLALTPAAYIVFARNDIECRRSTDFFTDEQQAKCAVTGREAFEYLRKAFKSQFTSVRGIEVPFSFLGYTITVISERIWLTLPDARNYVLFNGSGFSTYDTKVGVHNTLLSKLIHECEWITLPYIKPSCLQFRLWFRYWQLKKYSSYSSTIALSAKSKIHTFARAYSKKHSEKIVLVKPYNGASFISYLRSVLRGHPIIDNYAIPSKCETEIKQLQAIISNSSNSVRRALEPLTPLITHKLLTFISLYRDCKKILSKFPRKSVVYCQEANELQNSPLNCAAISEGFIIRNMNHNSLPLPQNETAKQLMQTMLEGRIINSLTSEYITWSPHTAAFAGRLGQGVTIKPHMPEYPPLKKQPYFKILYASNAVDYDHFYPFIIETSDEFAQAAVSFVENVTFSNNLRVTIRIRNKPEFNPQVFKEMAKTQLSEYVQIEDSGQDFLSQLSKSNLLVAYMSSTIEQALQMRIPVLLWGPTVRHQHLKAQKTPPTKNKRSAVYVVYDKNKLNMMIAAIKDAHNNRPLTNEELQVHLFK